VLKFALPGLDLTGSELRTLLAEPIWHWGLIERTASGLLLLRLGLDELARESLAIADAWAAAEVR
jgi:hypothetical protein